MGLGIQWALGDLMGLGECNGPGERVQNISKTQWFYERQKRLKKCFSVWRRFRRHFRQRRRRFLSFCGDWPHENSKTGFPQRPKCPKHKQNAMFLQATKTFKKISFCVTTLLTTAPALQTTLHLIGCSRISLHLIGCSRIWCSRHSLHLIWCSRMWGNSTGSENPLSGGSPTKKKFFFKR